MIFSGRGNTAHTPQGKFQTKKNRIKYLIQFLTDKSPNVAELSTVLHFLNGFKDHGLFLEAKRRSCSAMPARNLTPWPLGRVHTALSGITSATYTVSGQHKATIQAAPGYLFVATREETTRILQSHRALLVVLPTSLEVERVFSASGLYLTKLPPQRHQH